MDTKISLDLPLSKERLNEINTHLSTQTPEEILKWAVDNIPGLYQTTAFGLTGLVAIDMLSKITTSPPPLIFLDTLYHFRETYELVEDVKARYSVPLHVYKPEGCLDVKQFEEKHGERLWETDEDTYDFLVKVEPARRAYEDLGVKAVITGRRASQGADRASLKPLEVDSTGLLKLNPLFQWNFHLLEWYIKENNVPRNKLLDQGYRSVGDWHSTVKVVEGQDERAGRWAGKEKTECGLHKDYFSMKAQAKVAAGAFEHLGDAVLGLSVTNLLVDMYPGLHVGPSTKIRALVVGNATLAEISLKYKLPIRLRLHHAQAITLRASTHIQADVLESFIGGLYHEQGLKAVQNWLNPLFRPYATAAYRIVRVQHGLPLLASPSPSPRSLQTPPELASAPTPMTTIGHLALFNQKLQKADCTVEWIYSDTPEAGTDGKGTAEDGTSRRGTKTTPVWYVRVLVSGEVYGSGRGNTKKAARNEAAKVGLEKMGIFVW
ncbi:hypothetical protein H0H81_005866 [Sphagnurus paluster]|uniref:3'-phosphoadenylylsulfate reductase n=1 Tax=Sphagnurus paluster TaxID=117069 RepID=A0A9P7FX04_9AGAR|nr:hypothetical protein H0H81_005866 [Sphagnurus paluster]